ncbi:MAG TPA: 5'-nucleotidase C-terminal domain-containing protein [Synechococcales cyanobacterium M55_K2018_004]|nr:5'-nucleotidase C-terminal domain-containing protein [Synechococcales cyanobacterium M55_K2018_004]
MVFQLQILHGSDFEAGISALDDAVAFSTVVNALRDDFANTLILSSGDNYIPGPFFSAASDPALNAVLGGSGTAAPGRADIAILNEIGIQASAFGNHEFDLGTATIQSLIVPTGNPVTYRGALFPYLSANLNFSGDANLASRTLINGESTDGKEASTIPGRIARYTVITVNGERIGIVGATTPTLPIISSPGPGVSVTPSPFDANPTPAQLDALAAEIQRSVDALTNTGVNKIVLLSHMQQLFIEQALATRLRNVDIIIAGGSHTLLADSGDRLRPGDTAAPGLSYPILTTSASGERVLIVNTAANYTYVGRLVAEFDSNGVIKDDSLDPAINGAYATDAASVAALIATNTAAGGVTATPDPEVVAITNALRNVIVAKDGTIFGRTSVFLNGTRNDVRTQETNLGNLTADANLFVARQVDPTTVISLKNGGGIRDNIGAIQAAPGATDPNQVEKLPPLANPLANKQAGDVSQLDVENSLRFNNALSLVTVTATQLKELMEHAVAGVRPGATPGAFPQVGGLSFSFDATRTARSATTPGDRIRSLAIKNASGRTQDVVVVDGVVVGDPNRTFRMVTLNFLANGGDGYPFANFAATLNRVDLLQPGVRTGQATFADDGTEQDAFAEYLNTIGTFTTADTAPAQDTRIQNLAVRRDGVFSDASRLGTPGNDQLVGTLQDDLIFAGAGADQVRGRSGNDRIFGQAGNDVLKGNQGDDVMDGGTGNDSLFGQEGNDTLTGGSGNDFIVGAEGDDLIFGGDGDDALYGGLNNDRLLGEAGNDRLFGGAGADYLDGGTGNDVIDLGADLSRDIAVIGRGNGTDRILNFRVATDRIGLSGGLSVDALAFTQVGRTTRIVVGRETLAILDNVQLASLTDANFVTV